MNENKFSGKSDVYGKGRPSYPDELFKYLNREGYINTNTVAADIGSGTGIFSRQLSEYASKVYAVEPNDDMRAAAEKSMTDYGNIISVCGNSDNTGLGNHSVDIVTAAQAFHWFNRQSFKNECMRILKKDGIVILVWNDRDTSSEVISRNFEVNRRYCANFKGSSNGMDFENETFSDFFDGEVKKMEFENNLIYDYETFILRNASSSYAPKKGKENYISYVDELKNIFDACSSNGRLVYPYITRCYIGKCGKK